MNEAVGDAGLTEGRRPSRRQYFRVGTRLPIRFGVIPASELEVRCQEISVGDRETGSEDSPLLSHLARIEAKLDQLLAQTEGPGSPLIDPFKTRPIEISGAGFRVAAEIPPPVGSSIWVEILLPGSPQSLQAVGTIRRHVPPASAGDSPEIAVEFRAIRTADRQAIVYFALEAERCRLRGNSLDVRANG